MLKYLLILLIFVSYGLLALILYYTTLCSILSCRNKLGYLKLPTDIYSKFAKDMLAGKFKKLGTEMVNPRSPYLYIIISYFFAAYTVYAIFYKKQKKEKESTPEYIES